MARKYFQVIYEDNHLIIVNKEPGILVQGDATGDKCLLDMVKDYIKEELSESRELFFWVPCIVWTGR